MEETVAPPKPNRISSKVSNCIEPIDVSIASNNASMVSSTDEGGFNEPSPEIKAKLRSSYPFDVPVVVPEKKDDVSDGDYNAHQHSLHYVDFGYRLNPDGSESKQCFSEETEEYAVARSNGTSFAEPEAVITSHVVQKKTTIHYPVADSVVYASIKTEPAIIETIKLKCDSTSRIDDCLNGDDMNVSDIDEKFEQIYSSTTSDKDADGPESFDLDNVEFADASDKDELPDAMTTYEADRLLSSR